MKSLSIPAMSIPIIDEANIYLPNDPHSLVHLLSEDKEMPIIFGNSRLPYFTLLRIEGKAEMTTKDHPIYKNTENKFYSSEPVVKLVRPEKFTLEWDRAAKHLFLITKTNEPNNMYQILIPGYDIHNRQHIGYIIKGEETCIKQLKEWNIRKSPSIDAFLKE